VFAFSLASPDDSSVATRSAAKAVSLALEATEVPSAKVRVFKKTAKLCSMPVCKFGMLVPKLLTEKGTAWEIIKDVTIGGATQPDQLFASQIGRVSPS